MLPSEVTMEAIEFFVAGIPKPQPRPRAFARMLPGGKAIARVYEAGTAEAWKGDVARASEAHRPAAPLEGPVALTLAFLLPRPKRLMRAKDPEEAIWAPDGRGDVDNLAKAVIDAMTVLRWWHDDAQVVQLGVTKHFAGKQEGSGVLIEVREIEP